MVPLSSLLLPILLSGVAVFILSSVIHMVLPYHRSDFAGLPNENEVMDALRRGNAAPREYMFPHHGGGMEALKDPAFVAKLERGPIGTLILSPGRTPSMAKPLSLWFIYTLVVSLFAAYIASRALAPGADDKQIVRFIASVAFIGYVLAAWQSSIWYNRPVSTNLKLTFDGLLYSLATAAVFCVMWP